MVICIMIRYYFDIKIYIWEHFELEYKFEFKIIQYVCIPYITYCLCGIRNSQLDLLSSRAKLDNIVQSSLHSQTMYIMYIISCCHLTLISLRRSDRTQSSTSYYPMKPSEANIEKNMLSSQVLLSRAIVLIVLILQRKLGNYLLGTRKIYGPTYLQDPTSQHIYKAIQVNL